MDGLKRLGILSVLLAGLFWLQAPRSWSQQPAVRQDSQELSVALSGDWTGVLEYRDYSEPTTSTKRVKLPTWLSVTPRGGSLSFLYTYDDGPAKTVVSAEMVSIDGASSRWTTLPEATGSSEGKAEIANIVGLPGLKSGRGVLVLTGPGIESGHPVEVRTTVRVGRNILEILRETSMAGGAFTFRHAYTFVRAKPPAGTAPAA